MIGVKTVTDEDDVICITEKGQTIRLPVSGVRVIGRATGGVRLMEMGESDKIVSVARVTHEEEAPGDGQQELPIPTDGGGK